MAERPIDSVYVSYSWGAEEETRLVDKLEEACRKRGIELKRDKKQIDYGDSIRAYMDELGGGHHVILVLSDAYFKSEYCMYELKAIYDKKDFRKRVYPVVLKGTRFHKARERVPYLRYWETEITALKEELATVDRTYTSKSNEDLDAYADFRRLMDELQAILADMNSLTADVHVNTDFEALLNRLIPPAAEPPPVSRPKRNRVPDSRFQSKIRDEIRRVLAKSKPLSDALQAEVPKLGESASKDIAESLCACEFDDAVDHLLRPATEASLSSLDFQRPEFTDTWEVAKTVLCWLSLLAVSDERIEELEKRESSGSDFSFEIIVNTPLGVEIVSSRYRQIAPKLHMEKGKADVLGAQAIHASGLDPSWNDDYALEQLLLTIWDSVFVTDIRKTLSPGDISSLNSALARREKYKTDHYYIPVSVDLQGRLCRPDFYDKLVAKLPAITVIYVKSSGGAPALRIADEYDFRTIIGEFLRIPDHLSKRT
jgi:hypothetical protein